MKRIHLYISIAIFMFILALYRTKKYIDEIYNNYYFEIAFEGKITYSKGKSARTNIALFLDLKKNITIKMNLRHDIKYRKQFIAKTDWYEMSFVGGKARSVIPSEVYETPALIAAMRDIGMQESNGLEVDTYVRLFGFIPFKVNDFNIDEYTNLEYYE